MAKIQVKQVDLIVDGDGPQAWFYRQRRGMSFAGWETRLYRPGVYTSAEHKRRFIDRVQAAQKALCKTIDNGGNHGE